MPHTKQMQILRFVLLIYSVIFLSRIGHDNKGGFAGWRLDNVEIEAPSIGKRLHFPCDRWLDLKEDDGLIERELTPVDKGKTGVEIALFIGKRCHFPSD